MNLFPIQLENNVVSCDVVFKPFYNHYAEPETDFHTSGSVALRHKQFAGKNIQPSMEFAFCFAGDVQISKDANLSMEEANQLLTEVVVTIARYIEISVGPDWEVCSVDFAEGFREEVGENLCHYNLNHDPDFEEKYGYAFRHGFAVHYSREELFPYQR